MKASFPQVIRPKNMRVREIQDPDITKSDPSKSDGNRILDLVMDEPKLKIFKRIRCIMFRIKTLYKISISKRIQGKYLP